MNEEARELAAAKAGDVQALARIYDRHAAVVLSLCRQCSGKSFGSGLPDAEDACQETFIRAFGLLRKLAAGPSSNGHVHDGVDVSETNVRPWLYAIARRVCSERRRSAQRRLHHESQAMIQLSHTTITREPEGVLADRAEADQLDRLTLAMDELDDRERLAIHLHYLDADPVIAAESALGLSRSAFYKLLARAREKLAAAMQFPAGVMGGRIPVNSNQPGSKD